METINFVRIRCKPAFRAVRISFDRGAVQAAPCEFVLDGYGASRAISYVCDFGRVRFEPRRVD